jgi:hypothetical protein
MLGNSDEIKMERKTEVVGEFPRIDDRFAGMKNRYGWLLSQDFPSRLTCRGALGRGHDDEHARADRSGNRRERFLLGRAGLLDAGAVLHPAPGSTDEGDGYLVVIENRLAEMGSRLLLFDALEACQGTDRNDRIPVPNPPGLHGNWHGGEAALCIAKPPDFTAAPSFPRSRLNMADYDAANEYPKLPCISMASGSAGRPARPQGDQSRHRRDWASCRWPSAPISTARSKRPTRAYPQVARHSRAGTRRRAAQGSQSDARARGRHRPQRHARRRQDRRRDQDRGAERRESCSISMPRKRAAYMAASSSARPGARLVVHEPVGPVAAFAPWNFPINNPARKLGAPIAAGCSVILKPAEEAPSIRNGVVQALLDAGLPQGVCQLVFGVPDEVSRHLLASPVIRKVSFTGSTIVGKHLLKLAPTR